MKETTLNFLKGNISLDKYIELCETDEFEFLQSLVKEGETAICTTQSKPGNIKAENIPYVAKDVLLGMCKKGTLASRVDCFSEICRLMRRAFPNENFEIDYTLLDSFRYVLNNTPEYIGGREAEQVLATVYCQIPTPETSSGRAEYKRLVKDLFRCRDKSPKWLQEPEWPVRFGKPMTFVKEYSDDKQKKHYLFIDEEMEETVDIIQFY